MYAYILLLLYTTIKYKKVDNFFFYRISNFRKVLKMFLILKKKNKKIML